MPGQAPPRIRLGAVEPQDAVAAFQQRKLLAPSFHWHDIWAEEHAAKFMVAGVAQADVLRIFRDAIAQALPKSGHLKDFAALVKPQLQAKGWWGNVKITNPQTGEIRTTRFDDARLQLIYDTNLRQSYAAGRWAAAVRNKARQPLLMYRTMRDERVRITHRPWDGVVLPIEHPWWNTHYPPCGWRCRCRAIPMAEKDVQRYRDDGVDVKTEPPPSPDITWRDPRTGDAITAPVGVDPGFGYNPGSAYLSHAANLRRAALDGAEPDIASAMVQQSLSSSEFARFVRSPLPGEAQPVAMASAGDAAALGSSSRVAVAEGTAVSDMGASVDDWRAAQEAIDAGQRIADGADGLAYLLDRGGIVTAVWMRRTPQGLTVTRLARMPAADAAADPEISALRDAAAGG